MKRFLLVLAIVAGLTVVFTLSAHSQKGQIDIVKEEISFDVKADGSIIADTVKFNNMTEYFLSDHFRGTNKRCKPVDAKGHESLTDFSKAMGSTADCTSSCTTIKAEYWPSGTYTIPVVFHVIYKSDGTGNIPDSRIINQVAVLNEDYRAMSGTLGGNGYDTKIQFELAGITRYESDRYFADRNERKYKSLLAWDQNEYLNVYVNSASGYLGYAYFPQTSAGTVYDGVVLLYSACGGRDEGSAPYNQGRTLTHEVGHYLGLYHTFQDGCATGYCAGDRIEDTNAEAAPYYYCGSYSSCGTADPTTNYMDYSEDLCMWQFTAEQSNRAVCSLVNYRPTLYY
jgi:Pregnancy-associated plasma protein-A